jgi:tripartite-type tricarboxylate transporter receptor subunit TctC
MQRARRIAARLILALLACAPAAAWPQDYPARPIRLIITTPAGGLVDVMGRLFADELSARLGQPIVIDNRPGGMTQVGADALNRAAPDGYTLMIATSESAMLPFLKKSYRHDPIKDFTPVALVTSSWTVFAVHPGVPAQTLPELVAYAKANPGKLHNGAGVASPPHIAWGLFTITTGTDIVFVPYRAMAQAMTDLVSGQIQMMIDGIGSLLPHIRDGKARAVAVTGTARSPDLPGVPTMIESGYPDYRLTFWTGVLAPAGTPPAFVGKLNAAINEGLQTPDMRESLAKFNVEPNVTSPQEFSAFLAAEARKWADVVKATNIKVE